MVWKGRDPKTNLFGFCQSVKTLRSKGVYARRKAHSHNSKHSRLGKKSIGKVKVHELTEALERMALKCLYTKWQV